MVIQSFELSILSMTRLSGSRALTCMNVGMRACVRAYVKTCVLYATFV